MNPNSTPDSSYTDVVVDITFSPLFHIPLPMLEIVLGPKLGLFGESISISDSYSGTSSSGSASGLAYGFNAGVFVPLGNIAIGGLLNYTRRNYAGCSDSSSSDCFSPPYDVQVWGISGAMIF